MSIGMHITRELQQQIELAAERIRSEGVNAAVVNAAGLVLVVKGSSEHLDRVGKVQYLGDYTNGGQYLLFAS